jgi:glutamate racemase
MIGIFDSGVGGFSVLKKLREREPHADVLYFADIANVPYGNRSQDELLQLTLKDIDVLLKHGARQIVSACNSVSQSVAQVAREKLRKDFDYIEMTLPTIESFRGNKSSILVVGTEATISSKLYQTGLSRFQIRVDGIAVPQLAGAIENGDSHEHIRQIIKEAFSTVSLSEYQIVLLSCTHFPLVLTDFKEVLGNSVIFFDPAESVTGEIVKRFHVDGIGKTQFLLSKDSPVFRKYAAEIIFRDAPIEILE